MKFYHVSINDVAACVISDQMTDAEIQAAIEQELDCLGYELETVTVERSEHTLGSKVPGELVVIGQEHDYNTTPITVHGVNTVTGDATTQPAYYHIQDSLGQIVATATFDKIEEAIKDHLEVNEIAIDNIQGGYGSQDVTVKYKDDDAIPRIQIFSYERVAVYD